jgi:hypothetical protein
VEQMPTLPEHLILPFRSIWSYPSGASDPTLPEHLILPFRSIWSYPSGVSDLTLPEHLILPFRSIWSYPSGASDLTPGFSLNSCCSRFWSFVVSFVCLFVFVFVLPYYHLLLCFIYLCQSRQHIIRSVLSWMKHYIIPFNDDYRIL